MTANYRTRLIGIAHRHFLNIPDIACFFVFKRIRVRRNTLIVTWTRCVEDFSCNGFRFFVCDEEKNVNVLWIMAGELTERLIDFLERSEINVHDDCEQNKK